MEKYKFDCGCEVNQLNDTAKIYDGLPALNIDYDDIYIGLNYKKWCNKTWELISKGYTRGVFQLESYLGKSWARKLQPNNMEEVCALIALIRPGVLKAMTETSSGKTKSMTQLYVDRKHGVEKNEAAYKELEPILASTYQVLTYQEQSMKIATHIAGFNEQEADVLRKAIGKKKPELMAKLKSGFIDGAEKVGYVTKEEAEEIFAWIEKSNRYSFNKSHSYAYGESSYLSAFVKYHFPLHFFCSWIKFAREKPDAQDELRNLVAESKLMNVSIKAPSMYTLLDMDGDVCIKSNAVYIGIKCMKGIGESSINKMVNLIHGLEKLVGKSITTWTWIEFLRFMLGELNKTVVNNLICSGVFSHLKLNRQRLLHEYNIYNSLTSREQAAIANIEGATLFDVMEKLIAMPRAAGGPATKSRSETLKEIIKGMKQPGYLLEDSPKWILTQEKELFGTPLTYSVIDTIAHTFESNTTCKEFEDGRNSDNMSFTGEIVSSREWTIKSGKNSGQIMGFITLEDTSGKMDCVAFSDVWEEYNHILTEGNTVALMGTRSNKGSLMIQKVFQI